MIRPSPPRSRRGWARSGPRRAATGGSGRSRRGTGAPGRTSPGAWCCRGSAPNPRVDGLRAEHLVHHGLGAAHLSLAVEDGGELDVAAARRRGSAERPLRSTFWAPAGEPCSLYRRASSCAARAVTQLASLASASSGEPLARLVGLAQPLQVERQAEPGLGVGGVQGRAILRSRSTALWYWEFFS